MFSVIISYNYLTDYTASLSATTATGNHFSALQNSFKNMLLFGGGLGTSGFNALLYGDSVATVKTSIDTSTTESFFATLLSQVGLLGSVIYYVGGICIVRKLKMMFSETSDFKYYSCFVMLFAVLVESLISASSISMLGSGISFIFAGVLEQKYRNKRVVQGISHRLAPYYK